MSITPEAWIKAGKPTPKLVTGGLVLRDQINKRWPNRDKRSDGWISDAAHQSRKSDHNPDARGIVHALDIDHNMGKAGKDRQGKTAQQLADELIEYARMAKAGSERLKYVVYNNQIASGTYKDRYWVWRKGNYGHTQHIHVSFTNTGESDPRKFDLPIFGTKDDEPALIKPTKPAPAPIPKFPGKERLTFGKKNESVRRLQRQLIARGYKIPSGATSYYGPQTQAAVRSLYHKMRKNSDGKSVGPAAWSKLFGE
jgi:hypothetical protein